MKMTKEHKDKIKQAVSKANTGKIRNPKGKNADLVKLEMTFEEAVKRAVNKGIKKEKVYEK